jgi:hypothetical protein
VKLNYLPPIAIFNSAVTRIWEGRSVHRLSYRQLQFNMAPNIKKTYPTLTYNIQVNCFLYLEKTNILKAGKQHHCKMSQPCTTWSQVILLNLEHQAWGLSWRPQFDCRYVEAVYSGCNLQQRCFLRYVFPENSRLKSLTHLHICISFPLLRLVRFM